MTKAGVRMGEEKGRGGAGGPGGGGGGGSGCEEEEMEVVAEVDMKCENLKNRLSREKRLRAAINEEH